MTDTSSWGDRAAVPSRSATWWRPTGAVRFTAGRDGPGLRIWGNVELVGQCVGLVGALWPQASQLENQGPHQGLLPLFATRVPDARRDPRAG